MKDQAGLGKYIALGTRNPTKLAALVELLPFYPLLRGYTVKPIDVGSGVDDQPMSLGDTIVGAKWRAFHAFQEVGGADFSVGIESGLMNVEYVGYMDVCACAIFCKIPGPNLMRDYSIGLSGAWKFPEHAMDLVLNEGLDMTQACVRAGISTNEKLGDAEGAIGVLTGGLVTRKDYTKQAIQMAFVDAMPHLRKEACLSG